MRTTIIDPVDGAECYVVWSLNDLIYIPERKPPVTAQEFAVMMAMIRNIQERLGA